MQDGFWGWGIKQQRKNEAPVHTDTCLNLFVRFESHQTANLVSTGVKDTGTYKVFWVGIDAVQNPSSKAHQLTDTFKPVS